MSRRIPIRFKLISALAIPIVALLVVSAFQVLQSRNEANDVREQANLARAAIGPSGAITALQDERNAASAKKILNIDIDLPVETHEEAIERTDAAMEEFRAELDRLGAEARAIYQPALDMLDHLDNLRAEVTDRGSPGLENIDISAKVFTDYTNDIGLLIDATSQVVVNIDDATLRQGVELTDLTTRQTDAIAQTFSSIFRPWAFLNARGENTYDEETIVQQAGLLNEVITREDQIRALGTGEFAGDVDRLLRESDALGFNDKAREAINMGEDLEAGTILEMQASVSAPRDQAYYGFRDTIGEKVEQRADALVDAADNRQRLWSGMAAMVLMIVMVITWLVSRSITRPLRSLTQQAKEMAEHKLPDAVLDILETPLGDDVQVPQVEPVTVRTSDEVADVADALNTVQDSALDLAVEQAVLRRNIADSFVNLGRRNQNLLGRQLDFITELESNETDPDTLASLFRLDHLATRMRRNAESLLVLAGIEPPRKWAAPVRITDVIRAALGEVEDYQRVTVRGVEPATILGSAAADIAHLIAEFVENALTFSPPDQQVDIRGRHRPDTGGYTLAVIDSGLGMTPADIAQANRRLAGHESFTIAPSKYLGHYVAGNLAARHGIHLQLDNSPGNGITATIELPATLLTTEEPTDEPITPPHGGRAIGAGAQPADGRNGEAEAGAPGEGEAGRPPAPEPADAPAPVAAITQPSRTASGLVKRAPRTAAGAPAAANVPDADLLATLSNHASNLPGSSDRRPILPGSPGPMSSLRSPTPPGPAAGPGQAPGAPPGGPPSGQPPAPPSGTRAPRPPTRPHVPLRGHQRPGPAPASPQAQPATRRPPARPTRPTPPPPTQAPAARPAPAPAAGGESPWAGLESLRTAPQTPVSPNRRGGGPARPPQPPPDPAAGGMTSSGLTRRVRGAQLPQTQPLTLRREVQQDAAGPGPTEPAGGTVPADGGGAGYRRGDVSADRDAAGGNGDDSRSDDASPAKDVYSFLSSFTAGVQRGLDEARRNTTNPEDDR